MLGKKKVLLTEIPEQTLQAEKERDVKSHILSLEYTWISGKLLSLQQEFWIITANGNNTEEL